MVSLDSFRFFRPRSSRTSRFICCVNVSTSFASLGLPFLSTSQPTMRLSSIERLMVAADVLDPFEPGFDRRRPLPTSVLRLRI